MFNGESISFDVVSIVILQQNFNACFFCWRPVQIRVREWINGVFFQKRISNGRELITDNIFNGRDVVNSLWILDRGSRNRLIGGVGFSSPTCILPFSFFLLLLFFFVLFSSSFSNNEPDTKNHSNGTKCEIQSKLPSWWCWPIDAICLDWICFDCVRRNAARIVVSRRRRFCWSKKWVCWMWRWNRLVQCGLRCCPWR